MPGTAADRRRAKAITATMPMTSCRMLGRTLAEGFAFRARLRRIAAERRGARIAAHLPPSAFVAFLQNHDQTGNRAFGERLSHLADPPEACARARRARALAANPLLFMGEEWAASSPFLFFVDFSDDGELAAAVRDGRRREFARFRAFADTPAAEEIPDPTARSTASQSVLRLAGTASSHRIGTCSRKQSASSDCDASTSCR